MKYSSFLLIFVVLCNGFVFSFADAPADVEKFVENPDDQIRQEVVKAVDGKKDQKCLQVEDHQCPRRDVTFWLYMREHQNNPIQLDPFNEETLRNPEFIHGAPLKILIHGYTMNKDKAINEVLRPAYFDHGEYNIISVDWSPLCINHCYTQAARSTPTVGFCVATFLSGLLDMHAGVFSEVHVLGHSMGAHVSSWASQSLNLDRLTEFDPALPLFSDDDKLYVKGHAKIVDVWHSNSALKGRQDVSGTVDIYFNDEMDQPGCKCDTSCSHLRAVQYYGETITRESLAAFPCEDGFEAYRSGECPVPRPEDLGHFGEHFDQDRTGTYLAFTNSQSPFIVPAEYYTDPEKFKSFEESHDEQCPKHDFMAFFGQLFDL